MRRSALIGLLSFAMANIAGACTCVSAVGDTARLQMRTASLVFRGTLIESKLLPQHPEMKGRQRYAVTFRVDRYWKGVPAQTVVLYDLDGGTDCYGFGYQVGKEYLVYASQQTAQDYKLEDVFWFGWTDVLPAGTSMLQDTPCTPGGETSNRLVRKALRQLGPGQRIRHLKTKN